MHDLHLAMVHESFAMVSLELHALQSFAKPLSLQNLAMQIGLQQRRRKPEHMLNNHSKVCLCSRWGHITSNVWNDAVLQ